MAWPWLLPEEDEYERLSSKYVTQGRAAMLLESRKLNLSRFQRIRLRASRACWRSGRDFLYL